MPSYRPRGKVYAKRRDFVWGRFLPNATKAAHAMPHTTENEGYVLTPSVRSQIPGALIFVGAGLFGAYRLLRWLLTGEVWVDFRSKGEPNDYRLITFHDYPVSFLFEFFINGLFATAGIVGAISLARWMRCWCHADDGHESNR
ncbi:hypothetical protein [Tardiphaga sp. 839_C3_N1_4]|uniref:hypothetical protein n=1 Tax=Tardiphaga sp. 839_C3_N1_4 TaxID=3240761 RepID=UPI003F23943E